MIGGRGWMLATKNANCPHCPYKSVLTSTESFHKMLNEENLIYENFTQTKLVYLL